MKEFMLYIRNSGDAKASLTSEDHLTFVKKCELYIGRLTSQGNLIVAQPVMREGIILTNKNGKWTLKNVDTNGEVPVGYYHLAAKSIDEALELAKDNPEFEYVKSAIIEIHEIKTKEEQTDFVYPK